MFKKMMKRILIWKKHDWVILKYLQFKNFCYIIRTNLWSQQLYFIIQLNFKDFTPYHFKREPAGELVPLTTKDIQSILQNLKNINGAERRELLGRIHFAFHNVPQGYCIKESGEIRYIQWLVEPKDKDLLQTCYPNRLNELKPHQVMLENAYTFKEFRGMGYYYYVTSKLIEQAQESGYKFAIGYVRADKVDSFNTMLRLGFKITHVQQEKKRFGLVQRKIISGKEI